MQTNGALPPSSNDIFLRVPLLCFIKSLPIGVEPVNESFAMIGLCKNCQVPTQIVSNRRYLLLTQLHPTSNLFVSFGRRYNVQNAWWKTNFVRQNTDCHDRKRCFGRRLQHSSTTSRNGWANLSGYHGAGQIPVAEQSTQIISKHRMYDNKDVPGSNETAYTDRLLHNRVPGVRERGGYDLPVSASSNLSCEFSPSPAQEDITHRTLSPANQSRYVIPYSISTRASTRGFPFSLLRMIARSSELSRMA